VWRPDEHASTWHFGALKDSIVYTADSSSYGAKITSHWATPFKGQPQEPFAYVTNGVAGEAFHFPRLAYSGAFASKNKVEINDFRSGFTFSVWLRILDTEDGDTVEQVFVKNELTDRFGLPSDTFIQYHVCYKPNENQVYFKTYAHKNTLYPMFSGEIAPIINSAFSVDRPDDQWHYYSFVSDGMNLYAYRDGVCIKSRWWPLVLNGGALPNKNIYVSFGNAVNQYNRAHGSIDEYRAERVGRSAAWIKACYDNQKQGSSFVTVGGTYASGMVIVVR
jgi:hypothetical protein